MGCQQSCKCLRVFSYIEANYPININLDDLAKVAAMSRCAFVRAWRRATGTTPMLYVCMRRIDHARRMLTHSDACISSIALACGFCSHSHFTTVFTGLTGETPTAYRLRMSR